MAKTNQWEVIVNKLVSVMYDEVMYVLFDQVMSLMYYCLIKLLLFDQVIIVWSSYYCLYM